jgi:hypothetical protein
MRSLRLSAVTVYADIFVGDSAVSNKRRTNESRKVTQEFEGFMASPKLGFNAKNPAARPGFVFVEAGAEECGLIFGDDRRRSVSVEQVGEPGLHLVFPQGTRPADKTAVGQRSRPTESAEIGIAVFGPDRPIGGEGIFDSAANRPAGAVVRTAPLPEEGHACRVDGVKLDVAVDAAEGDAAGGVDLAYLSLNSAQNHPIRAELGAGSGSHE